MDKQIIRDEKEFQENKIIEENWNNLIFNSTTHKIVIGDSKKMSKIKDSELHLIVTSPPYFNAKLYSQWETLKDYLCDIEKTFKECLRVLQPGRKFCLNISDLPEKGESGVRWIPLGAELLKLALNVGFELVDRIIWFKTPVKGFQYGSLPYPPSPLICDSMEYIFILRKPGKSDYSHLTKIQKDASRLRRMEYMEFTKQIWTISRVRLKNNTNGHIAPFPDDIPHRCIRLYSFVGETILDPFGGSGTTSKMALRNKRNSILYELKEEYLRFINEKLDVDQFKLYEDIKVNVEYE